MHSPTHTNTDTHTHLLRKDWSKSLTFILLQNVLEEGTYGKRSEPH